MPAALSIQRLTAQVPAHAQPVSARLALQSLAADLEDAVPRGLPPQALLWMRRLRLQAPEAALLNAAPAAGRHAWVDAGREQMAQALAQAARPALGGVPDSAPAVLFADEAEMLACLALAAQAGELDRWWWRSLLGRAWPQPASAWQARPQAQLATRRLLNRLGQGRALATLDPAEAAWVQPTRAAAPVPLAFADPTAAAGAREAAPPASARDGGPQQVGGPVPQHGAGAALAAGADAAMPGVSGVGGVGGDGEPPARVSVASDSAGAAGAGAASSPGRAVPVAAQRLHGRAATVLSQRPSAPVRSAASQMPAARYGPGDLPAAEAGGVRLPAAAGLPPPTAGEAHEPTATAPSADGALPPRAVGEPLEATPAEPAAAMLWGDGVGDAPLPAAPSVGRGRAALGPGQVAEGAQVDVIAASPAWPWPQALHSHAAPLLFVVNALLEDGLYPDFTRPRDPGLPVPMWALLAALAAAWRLPPDPLLALLAERGVGDLPLDMPAAPGVAAAPWPQWLAAYARGLRRRLSRRLGRRPSALAGALVLARPAQLWLSEAEWVAEFDLAGHDVAWRLAGLDRDPGWLPASGCSLRFVFHS